jgi:hypothetical protein
MKTLDEVVLIVENLNEEAHEEAWDSWVAADELEESSEDDDDMVKVEEMREEASDEQAGYFRDGFDDLDENDRAAITHWLLTDSDFKEQFKSYFGYEAFEDIFGQ